MSRPLASGTRAITATPRRAGATLAQFALAWILSFDAVSTVIPGARRPGQVAENVGATRMASLDAATREQVRRVYDESIRPLVHHLW